MTTRDRLPYLRRLGSIGLVSFGTGLFLLGTSAEAPSRGFEALYLVEDLLYLPVHFTALERALLMDGADGRLDRYDQLFYAATHQALADAGISYEEDDQRRTGPEWRWARGWAASSPSRTRWTSCGSGATDG